MNIESVNNDVQKCVLWWLPYIDLNRYRRVSKRWKTNIDFILPIYPSAWILNGLLTLHYANISYSNDGIHRWFSSFEFTQLWQTEVERIFPEQDNPPLIYDRLLKQQAVQFVKERIKMYNIIFGTNLDPNKPIFHERLLEVVVLPIPGEFHIRMFIQEKNYTGQFTMACFPKEKAIGDCGEVTQGNMVWCGINKGLTIEDFEKNTIEYDVLESWMDDASRGFYNNQHILEVIMYRTQRVFNALEIDWQNFIHTPVNLDKLRLQHEVYYRIHSDELNEK